MAYESRVHMRPQAALEGGKPDSRSQTVRQRTQPRLTAPWYRVSTVWLAVLATVTVAYLVNGPLIAVSFAILLHLLLSPVVGRLARWYVPRFVAAILVVATLLAVVYLAASATLGPIRELVQTLPSDLATVRREIVDVRASLQEAKETADMIDDLSVLEKDNTVEVVELKQPTWLENLVSGAGNTAAYAALTLFLTTLLLAQSRPLFVSNGYIRRVGWHRHVLVAGERVRRQIARYLQITTAINLVLGLLTVVLAILFDLANPWMWGLLAAVSNFVPYLGAAVVTTLLAIAGIVEFESLSAGILPALAYFSLTSIEGQLVTPSLLGNGLKISPVAVFLSVVMMTWLWGIPGAVLAVPLALSVKTLWSIFSHPTRTSGSAVRTR